MFVAGTRQVISPSVFELNSSTLKPTRHIIAIIDTETIHKRTIYKVLIQTRAGSKVTSEETEWLDASDQLLLGKPAMLNSFKKAIRLNDTEVDCTSPLDDDMIANIQRTSQMFFNEKNMQPNSIISASFTIIIRHVPDFDRIKVNTESLEKVLSADTGYSALVDAETDKDLNLTTIYTQLGIVHNQVIAHRRLVSGQLGLLSLLFQGTVLDSGKKGPRDAKSLARAFLRPQLAPRAPPAAVEEKIDEALARAAKDAKKKRKGLLEKTSNAARKIWFVEKRNTLFFLSFGSGVFLDDSLHIATLEQTGLGVVECEHFVRTVVKIGGAEKFTQIDSSLSDRMFDSGVRHMHDHLAAQGYTELPLADYLLWAHNRKQEITRWFMNGTPLSDCIDSTLNDKNSEQAGK